MGHNSDRQICRTSCTCRYSTSNTRSGIESCGILAGSLREKQGVFVISTLIIPKQEGTSDTVQALNEEEIFDVQDKRALYPLGWIHTHPTQTCFLSSVDVHTQCGYQVSFKLDCWQCMHSKTDSFLARKVLIAYISNAVENCIKRASLLLVSQSE